MEVCIVPFGLVAFLVALFVFQAVFGQNHAKLLGDPPAGIPARGILLDVSPLVRGRGTSVVRPYQLRSVRVDVEIPGRAPYEVTATIAIPNNLVRDVLPGATVELRIDPRNPQTMAVVGPGVGFTGAVGIVAPQGRTS